MPRMPRDPGCLVRIMLDIRHRGTRSGAVSYIRNLVPALLKSGTGHEYLLLVNEQHAGILDVPCERVLLPRQSPAAQALYDQVALPRLIRRVGADVYHPLKYLGSLYSPCPQVTTAHAITAPFEGSFPVGAREAVYWRHLGHHIFRRSAAVIAVSEYIRRFLVEKVGVRADRISVVSNGIDARFRQLPDHHRERGEARPYLLTVGNIFPVKNFLMAVRVLAGVADEFPQLRLVMAGATSHDYFQVVRTAVAEAGLAQRVEFRGYVEPAELVPLMNGAELLLMPSLTEGCPVTLLEAMACGTPVLASGRGGIPETGGDAIGTVSDPLDEQGWIAAASELLRQPELRQELTDRALQRSALFTWERTAAKTLAVYESLRAA
jgi:glycosyltransferase involved in cell wall biosynthesis